MSEKLEDYELDYLIDVVKSDVKEFNPKIYREPKIMKAFFDNILHKLIKQQTKNK
jgi:pyruvate-formate lyase-activating enzyme